MGKDEFSQAREEIIRTYNEISRRAEIQSTFIAVGKEFVAKEPTIHSDYCNLYEDYMGEYKE